MFIHNNNNNGDGDELWRASRAAMALHLNLSLRRVVRSPPAAAVQKRLEKVGNRETPVSLLALSMLT